MNKEIISNQTLNDLESLDLYNPETQYLLDYNFDLFNNIIEYE